MSFLSTLRRDWLARPRADILAGIVVALALIPEAIGFSLIAGVDPKVGLYASFSIAVIISLVGGRPGMISAATAAVAVLVAPLVRDHGVDYLFAATVLMGVIQVLAGFLPVSYTHLANTGRPGNRPPRRPAVDQARNAATSSAVR